MTRPLRSAEAGTAGGRIVFALAGKRFALPIEAVEGVAAPPLLARVPHAAPALLGAGHLGGRIVPIVDLARLLGRERAFGAYDGRGEVLRLRVAGGGIGLWIDKVERVIAAGDEPDAGIGDVQPIDLAALLAAGIDAPGLAAVPQAPLGDATQVAPEAPVRSPAPAFIVVEAGGKLVALPRQAVQELVATVAWTPVPRAPDGFLGVGLRRGAALPVLSLAVLLGLRGGVAPRGFFSIAIGGRRALVAVDRIVGLRFQSAAGETAEPLDVAAAIPEELRRIVLGFSPDRDAAQPDDGASHEVGAYLAFTVAGLDCALPAACVDRIIGPQPLIRLPCTSANGPGTALLEGAIELRGQVLPVAALCARLGLPASQQQPQGYVILRDANGRGAIGIDQARQLIELRRSDIVPAPEDGHGALRGVVARPEGGLLRIIAPDRLWRSP
jgi:purine-binding chemotaxis protein CheW